MGASINGNADSPGGGVWPVPGDGTAESPGIDLAESYEALRGLARNLMRGEKRGDLLQTTALVHEAYLRLAGRTIEPQADVRATLFMAARTMRAVLVDHARKRRSIKRGGAKPTFSLDNVVAAHEEPGFDLVSLDEALDRLTEVDPELSQVVELRFYGRLTEPEIGKILGKSQRSVRRIWRIAKMWLRRELNA